jgi:hypothetical protein
MLCVSARSAVLSWMRTSPLTVEASSLVENGFVR